MGRVRFRARKRWTIPAAHTKNRREHAVPLTDWAIAELKALKKHARDSRFVLPGKHQNRPANSKLITRGVKRLLPRFLAHEIESFTPHDLRRTGRTTLGRLGVTPFVAERVINHSKDVLEETYDLWDYFDEKRDALERLERYLQSLKAKDADELNVQARPRPDSSAKPHEHRSGLPRRDRRLGW